MWTGHKRGRRADRQPAWTTVVAAVSRIKHVEELGTCSLQWQEIWAVIFREHGFTLKNYSHLSGNIPVEIKRLEQPSPLAHRTQTFTRWMHLHMSVSDYVYRCVFGRLLFLLFGVRNGVGELMILNFLQCATMQGEYILLGCGSWKERVLCPRALAIVLKPSFFSFQNCRCFFCNIFFSVQRSSRLPPF